MKSTYSIDRRNEIVEQHLWCIEAVMDENAALIRAAHMDRDDVYQQLALRLIQAVAGCEMERFPVQEEIMHELHQEVFRCRSAQTLCGMTYLPSGFRRSHVISLEVLTQNEIAAAA